MDKKKLIKFLKPHNDLMIINEEHCKVQRAGNDAFIFDGYSVLVAHKNQLSKPQYRDMTNGIDTSHNLVNFLPSNIDTSTARNLTDYEKSLLLKADNLYDYMTKDIKQNRRKDICIYVFGSFHSLNRIKSICAFLNNIEIENLKVIYESDLCVVLQSQDYTLAFRAITLIDEDIKSNIIKIQNQVYDILKLL